ncbi:hypothetical protein SAMN02990966_01878 [Rhodospirillales bacterium URHD0017]|nr:hypothetical protein SAMN02990966_01878 [Rhodospirillales bacterium URHD0017]
MPSGTLRADQASCDEFRKNIVDMDAKSGKLPGYLPMRARLSSLYGKLCAGNAGARAAEYWFSLDGKNLGSTENPRPTAAAYATTAEIGRACAAAAHPSVCALERGAFAMCKAPPDPETRSGCDLLGAYPTSDDPAPDIAAPPLPKVSVSVDGRTFPLDADCYNVLAAVSSDNPTERLNPHKRLANSIRDRLRFERLSESCPDFLSAMVRRLGADPQQAPATFWPALSQLVSAGFPAAGAPSLAPGQPGGLPLAFCREVQNKMDTCRARWNGIGPGGSRDNATRTGQAGAFGDCYALYRDVYGMCRITGAASAPLPPPLPKSPPPPPGPQQQPTNRTGSSSPPTNAAPPSIIPPAAAALSPNCKAQLGRMLEGADAGDNSKAQAAYGSLRAVECDAQVRALAGAANVGLPERRMTARGRSALERADRGDLGDTAQRLGDRAPESFDNGEIFAFGLALFSFGVSAAVGFSPSAGGAFSTVNRSVTGTYGQGAPARPAPTQRPSTITGTGR